MESNPRFQLIYRPTMKQYFYYDKVTGQEIPTPLRTNPPTAPLPATHPNPAAPSASISYTATSNSTVAMAAAAASPQPSVHGVGPTLAASADPTVHNTNTSDAPSKKRIQPPSSNAATDVWWFMYPLTAKVAPGVVPDVAPLQRKPDHAKYPYVLCRLCPLDSEHSIYSLGDGSTSTLREHLRKVHTTQYWSTVHAHGLKYVEETSVNKKLNQFHEVFSKQGFMKKLIRWIVSDDQAINVVEKEEFRQLLLYLRSDLDEADIPHRTKVTELILQEYDTERQKVYDALKNALGRISITSDVWSDPNMVSYMAVTFHFCQKGADRHLFIRSGVLAFRRLEGAHTGATLAMVMAEILDKAGIIHKLGHVTLDNASNCDKMMEHLSKIMNEKYKVSFCQHDNRIRCFPHIINIAVQHMLKHITNALSKDYVNGSRCGNDDGGDGSDVDSGENNGWSTLGCSIFSISDSEYAEALRRDPIGLVRKFVVACRASGQRRERLLQVIRSENESRSLSGLEDELIPELQLLQDVPTRWSSTYFMIDRYLHLYEAIDVFLSLKAQKDVQKYRLSQAECGVLIDLHQMLEAPHLAQELLAAEKTPTLSMALPVFTTLIEKMTESLDQLVEIADVIRVGIEKLREYALKSQKSRVYALAMILNPSIKMTWINEYWTNGEAQNARKWMIGSMLEYKTTPVPAKPALKRMLPAPQSPQKVGSFFAQSRSASDAQSRGFNRLRNMSTASRRLQVSGSTSAMSAWSRYMSPPSTDEGESQSDNTPINTDESEIEKELDLYLNESGMSAQTGVELLSYWHLRSNMYPHLYRVALDILPVQASSVSSERVFSSSKETCNPRRNRLSPSLVEALQFLKSSITQESIDIAGHHVADISELEIG